MLRQAFRLYQRTLARCLPLACIGALLSMLAGRYASARIQALADQLYALMNDAASEPDSAAEVIDQVAAALRAVAHSPPLWASCLAALLIGVAFHGALIARQGDPPGSHWLALTLRRIPSLLLALVLLTLLASTAVLAVIASNALGFGAMLVVGLLILIAGSWLWGRLQLWLVAMFAHDLGAVAALQASWRLVRGHWWYVSSWISVAYLAIWIFSWLVQAAAGVVGVSDGALAGRAVSLLTATLTLPFLPAVWWVLYQELSARAPRGVPD